MKKQLRFLTFLTISILFGAFATEVQSEIVEKPISHAEDGFYKPAENKHTSLSMQSEKVLQAPCFDVFKTDISCFGAEDGTIQVIIDDTCGDVVDICLVYGSNKNSDCPPFKTMEQAEFTGLIAGTYYISVTGENGLVTTEEVVINEPDELFAFAAAEQSTICFDATTTVTVTAQGGTPPYSGTGNFIVEPGTHTFIVTDANECSAEVEITVEAFPVVEVLCRDNIFIGEFAQPIILEGSTPTGGVYSGAGITYDDSTEEYIFSAQDVDPGIYPVTYTVEENGCFYSCEFEIEVYEMPDFSCLSDIEVCEDALPLDDILPEGDEGFLTGNFVTDNVFYPEQSGPGTFDITYTFADDFGYLYSCTFFITVNELPEVTLDPFESVCSNTEPFSLTGGLPEGGIYSGEGIEDGIFYPELLAAGTYEITYTFTNEFDCTASATQTIEVLQAPCVEVSFTDVTCNGANDGTISVNITCGDIEEICLVYPGEELEKCLPEKNSGVVHTGLEPGTYIIVVTDTNGCVTIEEVTIGEPNALSISLVDTGAETEFGAADGFIEIAVEGGTPPYDILWNIGETTPRIENLAQGEYSVVVFDANDCIADATFEITGPTEPGDILIDLGVTIEVNIQTPDPEEVDKLIFAIVVTNHDEEETATGVVVENVIPEAFPFISRLDDGTSGVFDYISGNWYIGSIPAGGHVILVYQTQMLLEEEEEDKSWQSATNAAQILPFDQQDPDLSNNFADIVVTVGESSSGDDNGIESDGSMASQLALRNHRRLVENNNIPNDLRTAKMQEFSHTGMLTGTLKSASVDGNFTGISMLLPETGPASTTAFISTPADLLGITNAKEIFSVDYLQQNNSRRAAILAIATEPARVYEHTKVICDRLIGAELQSIEMIEIAGRPFILSKLVHPNGYIDYSVSFIAQRDGGSFVIDNRWYNEEYDILNTDDIFNFQVWSVTPQFTRQLVEEILNRMQQNGGVSFRNEKIAPAIPQVYVHSGRYTNGGLLLNLVNNAGADQITVYGSKTLYENAPREAMNITMTIPTDPFVEVFIPTGFLFDAGFSVSNNRDDAPDVLYYADGAWMFDYDRDNAVVNHFATEAETNVVEQIDYKVERDASFNGRVRTWASMFRSLSPRNMPVDLSGFDQIVFTAHGEGTTEVMLAKNSVNQWSEQYRTTISLTEEPQEYRINFSDLTTREGLTGFTPEDVVSVIFNPIGNGNSASNFDVNISNLHFANSSFVITPNAIFYPAYPNPFSNSTNIDLMVTTDSYVKVEVINMFGQTVEVLANEEMTTGTYQLRWTPAGKQPGIYTIRMTVGDTVYTSKVVFNK